MKKFKAMFKTRILIYFSLFLCVYHPIFAQRDSISTQYELKLRLFDRGTFEGMDNVKVKLINKTTGIIDSAMAIASTINFTIQKGNVYELLVLKKGYLTRRATFDAACFLQNKNQYFCMAGMELNNILKMTGNIDSEIETSMGLTQLAIDQVFKIENIYYDLNKWDIRPDAAIELDKLVMVLKDNPKIIVELGSHTDSRSSDEYNLNLSQKRAESAVAYIVEHGIAQHRISAKGYGEGKLINRCRNGIKCSEMEHQQNRRTEVRITGVLE